MRFETRSVEPGALAKQRSLVIVDASASLFPSSRSFRRHHCLRISPQLRPTKCYRKVVPGNTPSRISRVLKRSHGLQKAVAVENRYGKCHSLVTPMQRKIVYRPYGLHAKMTYLTTAD
ncbi:PREDICTED: uncharacterized protein LOC105150616 [Acromyrmex echinatior]|uniref:uncharacterized protein LOC105150616 n=1 Tax=Acromyrmex echinatior TaxID=103372 RepID=UPI000580D794|nr:PREDICTED: uncharacterized protein LOC105150616 [Acromyrmex echinatior]